ncbi:ribosome production factor 1 [Nematocida displodere]|uniref:Ribosome production factor 1 n=1 Tax=Nematocida displodere TaxID=1805483 RepID=A0A177EHJ5_9MICR|nr:ribosome production factor 1 [Nematocida displodere]
MKIILTSSNTKLTPENKTLLQDLEGLFPTAEPIPRRNRHFSQFLKEEAEGEALIIRLDQVDVTRKRLLLIRKDASGELTTSSYSVVSFVLCKNLGGTVDSGHMPEITLTNFDDSENDQRTIRDIEAIFGEENPAFEGRQVVSFTKKRGFIICRKHRYIIRLPEDPAGTEKVRFDEIGPRLAIKLQAVDVDNAYIFKHTKNVKLKD